MTDVLRARKVVQSHLYRTPLYHYPSLDEILECEVHVKHENHQPTGAFKVRGGVNLVSRLTAKEKAAGVICASTGNHGQSLAYAGRLFGVRTIIVVPEGANPLKVDAMRSQGAEVLFHGRDYDDAREHVEALTVERGYRYVHSGNEPLLIAGVATYCLEMLEDRPDLDCVIVPVGGGSGAAGCGVVLKALASHVRLIAVQSEAAPAAYRSWRAGRLVEAPMATLAEGLATRTAFELPQRMLRTSLDDFVLVGEEDLRDAIVLLLEKTRNLVEAAAAASLAAALKLRSALRGKRVALVLSGGNLSLEQLRDVLTRGA